MNTKIFEQGGRAAGRFLSVQAREAQAALERQMMAKLAQAQRAMERVQASIASRKAAEPASPTVESLSGIEDALGQLRGANGTGPGAVSSPPEGWLQGSPLPYFENAGSAGQQRPPGAALAEYLAQSAERKAQRPTPPVTEIPPDLRPLFGRQAPPAPGHGSAGQGRPTTAELANDPAAWAWHNYVNESNAGQHAFPEGIGFPSIQPREGAGQPSAAEQLSYWLARELEHPNRGPFPSGAEAELAKTFNEDPLLAYRLSSSDVQFSPWELGLGQGSFSPWQRNVPVPQYGPGYLWDALANGIWDTGKAFVDAPGRYMNSAGQTSDRVNATGRVLADILQGGTKKLTDRGIIEDDPLWHVTPKGEAKTPAAARYDSTVAQGGKDTWQADLLKTYYRGIKPTVEKIKPITDLLASVMGQVSPVAKTMSPAPPAYALYRLLSGSDDGPPQAGAPMMVGKGGVPGVEATMAQIKPKWAQFELPDMQLDFSGAQ